VIAEYWNLESRLQVVIFIREKGGDSSLCSKRKVLGSVALLWRFWVSAYVVVKLPRLMGIGGQDWRMLGM
jgi:hypothetical protein